MSSGILTEKRDLRTGRSVWRDAAGLAVGCHTRIPRKAKILIVGAGISGALLAYRLRHLGSDLLVVDRREPLQGSTAASTALVQFEIDTPLVKLSGMIGRVNAERAWRRSVDAVARLGRIVRQERIRCGWREAHSLYLAGDAFGRRALADEIEARAVAKIPGALINAATLRAEYGIDRTAAILSPGSAQANPMQLAAGLFRRARAAGMRLCSPVEITNIAADKTGVTLTAGDVEIAAGAAIFCTGYEVLKAVPDQNHKIKSTWAFASGPGAAVPSWLRRHVVWEGSNPYLYLRLTRDGRIVAGGEDEDFSKAHADPKLLVEKTDTIAEKLRALLPDLRIRIAYRWAGAFGESATGLPFIDAVPGHPNCYAVMGFGGNGITYATIAADVIAAALAGKPHPDADLYRFS
jgi:glycine/D-amino acid oxidase-like deaminating enzyme